MISKKSNKKPVTKPTRQTEVKRLRGSVASKLSGTGKVWDGRTENTHLAAQVTKYEDEYLDGYRDKYRIGYDASNDKVISKLSPKEYKEYKDYMKSADIGSKYDERSVKTKSPKVPAKRVSTANRGKSATKSTKPKAKAVKSPNKRKNSSYLLDMPFGKAKVHRRG